MREATRQQKLFIDEYLRTRKKNATKAAILAGYSKRSAQQQASQLLVNPIVANYLEEKERAMSEELQQEFIFDAKKAREVMYEILNKEDARDIDRITVAKDLLDRAGFKPVDKQEIKHDGALSVIDRANIIDKYLGDKDGN